MFEQKKIQLTPEQQFLAAYDEWASALWRQAYFRVGSKELAEDLVSEAFARAWDHYRTKPVDNLKALLYRILHNLIIDHYRKPQSTVNLDEISELKFSETPHADIADVSNLHSKLQKLPEIYRQVLVWRYIDDLDISEIAKLLSKTSTNVYVIIHRALKALREIYENQSL